MGAGGQVLNTETFQPGNMSTIALIASCDSDVRTPSTSAWARAVPLELAPSRPKPQDSKTSQNCKR